MEDKYYIIDYDYRNKCYFIRELVPIEDFNFFVRDIEYPKNELLGNDTWDGVVPYYGILLEHIKINKKQEAKIYDLNLIKGYYTDIKEAEKDLEKLIDFIEKSKEIYIF